MNNQVNLLTDFENHFLEVVDNELDFLSDENIANFQFSTDQTNTQSNESIESMETDEIPMDEKYENASSIPVLFNVLREELELVSNLILI